MYAKVKLSRVVNDIAERGVALQDLQGLTDEG